MEREEDFPPLTPLPVLFECVFEFELLLLEPCPVHFEIGAERDRVG